MIVHRTSAHLDEHKGIILHAFQRDHFSLNKFNDPMNSDFLFISDWIKKIKGSNMYDAEIIPLHKTAGEFPFQGLDRGFFSKDNGCRSIIANSNSG